MDRHEFFRCTVSHVLFVVVVAVAVCSRMKADCSKNETNETCNNCLVDKR